MAELLPSTRHVLERIAAHLEDPTRFDLVATVEELRSFHATGATCSFIVWKVAQEIRKISDGTREVP